MKKIMKKRKGFTLVELVAVVGIIAILSLIALPRFTQANKSANYATLTSNFNTIKTAITLYQADHAGELPADAGTDMDAYMEKTLAEFAAGIPVGSTYTWTGGVLTASITDADKFPTGAVALTFTP